MHYNYSMYIDDIRTPSTEPPVGNDWVVCRSYDTAIRVMRLYGCPKYVSFDHDLGDEFSETGYDIAQYMVELDMDMNGRFMYDNFEYNVHSANPIGKSNIEGIFKSYFKHRGEYDKS